VILKSIALTNFKNIALANLEFSPKVNCFLGNNGMGKSNLLDAIYFLSFAKSFSRVSDSMLITRGEDFGIVRGQYLRHGFDEEITAGLQRERRKSFRRGGKEYKRLSAHIGLLPAVMVAPSDLALVTDAAEERRRFIDMIISQGDATYLESLIRYNQALEQRNRMLRDGFTDATLFESIEMMMDSAAYVITSRRKATIDKLVEIFTRYYREIGADGEIPSIAYKQSDAEYTTLTDALEHARTRDTILKHTTVGPHRDDLVFSLDNMPLRQTASQGQTKTFTIALRMAQYEFLREAVGLSPLLLLDDIFDKLDAQRVERIISIVSRDSFGQIFITDTNRKHLDEIMRSAGSQYRMWSVADGSFTQIYHNEAD
jgi:DNA replication and repair protein RecF